MSRVKGLLRSVASLKCMTSVRNYSNAGTFIAIEEHIQNHVDKKTIKILPPGLYNSNLILGIDFFDDRCLVFFLTYNQEKMTFRSSDYNISQSEYPKTFANLKKYYSSITIIKSDGHD